MQYPIIEHRATEGRLVIPVEFGLKARLFEERKVLGGRHWAPTKSMAEGGVVLERECEGPLKVMIEPANFGGIGQFTVCCDICGLACIVWPYGWMDCPSVFHLALASCVRETYCAMFKTLQEMHGRFGTRFLAGLVEGKPTDQLIGCLDIGKKESRDEEYVYLGIVPSPELGFHAVASTELGYYEDLKVTTRKATKTIADKVRKIDGAGSLFR